MKIKKIAGTAILAGSLGAASLGLGAGSAQADRIWVPDIPDIPWGPGHWVDEWIPDVVPDLGIGRGPTGLGPPGQIKKMFPGCPPPGHWWPAGPHSIPPCIGW